MGHPKNMNMEHARIETPCLMLFKFFPFMLN